MWKVSPETEYFLERVEKEINEAKEELCDFGILLNPTEQTMREYFGNVGRIAGLKFLKEYIEEIDNEQDEALLRENESRGY